MKQAILQKVYHLVLTVFLLAVLCLFTFRANDYMKVFLQGVSLWATCVLPSSLPFLFLTALLTRSGSVERLSKAFSPLSKRLFGLSGVSGYCLLSSVLCGYPVGAKVLSDLYAAGGIRQRETTKMSILCSTSSPLFILGSVGSGLFQNQTVGLILLSSHLLSVLLSGVILRFFYPVAEDCDLPPLSVSENLLYESMYSSVLSCLCVGGFVCAFFTFATMLSDFYVLLPVEGILQAVGVSPELSRGVAFGLIEMTAGVGILSQSATPLSLAFCAFLITLGGVSILLQQICYFTQAKVSLRFFLPVKFLQAVFAFGICFLLCNLL